jgi:hypothetical protein
MAARAVVVCGVLLAGVLGACGGSSGDEAEGGGGGLSKAEYIERGDDICRRLDEAGESVVVPPREAPLSAHARFLDEVLAAVRPAHDEFAALEAPEGDTDAKERFDGYWDRVVSHLESARKAAQDDDRPEFDELLDELETDESLAEGFRDYGFEVCGST